MRGQSPERTTLERLAPTDCQADLLDSIDTFRRRAGRMPSVTELAVEYGAHPSGVYRHIAELRRKGYLASEAGRQASLHKPKGIPVLGSVGGEAEREARGG